MCFFLALVGVPALIISMAFRNIWRRKFRTSVTVISILVTSLLYSSIGSATTSLSIASIRAYTDYVGDFDILVTGTGKNVFFNATPFLDNISNIDGVYAVSPRLIFGAYVPLNKSYLRIFVVGINSSLDEGIGSFNLLKGSLEIGDNGCLILDEIAESNNLDVGDNITLYYITYTGKIVASNLTITGIVQQKGKIPIDMKNVIFVNLKKAQEMFEAKDLVDFLFIKLDQSIIDPYNLELSIEKIVDVGEKIQEVVGFDYKVTLVKAQVLRGVSNGIEFQKGLLYSFASMALIMAIILVVFTITMNLNERIREIGILRSLGLGKTRIFLLFITEATILGLIGAVLGSLLGVVVSQVLFVTPIIGRGGFLTQYVGGLSFNLTDLVLSSIIGVASAIVGGIYPAYAATRIEPAEALSPAARRAKEISVIEKKINPERPITNLIYIGLSMLFIFSFFMVIIPLLGSSREITLIFMVMFSILLIMLVSIVLVFSGLLPSIIALLRRIIKATDRITIILANINLLRRRKRTILAFFMITTAVSSLFLIGIMMYTQERSVVANIKVSAGADVIVYSESGLPLNVTENISSIQGVAAVCPVTTSVPVTVGDIVFWEKTTVNLYGVDPEGYVESSYLTEFVESRKVNLDELNDNLTVVISLGLSERLDLGLNDYLRLDLYGKTFKLRIIGILPIAPGFVFTRFPERATFSDILVSINTYKNITGFDPKASKILVKVEKGYSVKKVADEINSKLSESYDIQVITTEDYVERASETIEQLSNILSTLLDFAVIIAVLGLMASTITSIREREWEIGVLRALGSSRFQVVSIFVIETLLLVVLGYLTGLVSAFIAAYELNYSNALTSEIVVPISIPLNQLVSTFFIVMIPSLVLAIIVSYQATKKDIATVIRTAQEQ